MFLCLWCKLADGDSGTSLFIVETIYSVNFLSKLSDVVCYKGKNLDNKNVLEAIRCTPV